MDDRVSCDVFLKVVVAIGAGSYESAHCFETFRVIFLRNLCRLRIHVVGAAEARFIFQKHLKQRLVIVLWVLVLLFTGFAGFRFGFGKAVDKIIDKDVVEIDGFALVLEPVVILFIRTSRVCSELCVVSNFHGNKVLGFLQFGHDVCGAAKLSTVHEVLREDLQYVDVHTGNQDHDGAY